MAVSWPKGVVHEPSSQERMGFFFLDNVATAIGLIWLAVVVAFFSGSGTGWAGTRPPAPSSLCTPRPPVFRRRGCVSQPYGV